MRNCCDDELSYHNKLTCREKKVKFGLISDLKLPSGVEESGRNFLFSCDTSETKTYQLQSNYMRENSDSIQKNLLCSVKNDAVLCERKKKLLSSAHHENHHRIMLKTLCVSNLYAKCILLNFNGCISAWLS